jgi:ferredoxin-type protein NapF
MSSGESRRYLLLRGLLPADTLFPPYYRVESDFVKCLQCEEKGCLLNCPEKVIEIREGVPVLNFSENGCTFCDKCAEACSGEVLKVEWKRGQIGVAMIDPRSCLAWRGVVCGSCGDACPEGVIQFTGLWNPIVEEGGCTGCGFCLSVCPEPGAIKLFPVG